MAVITVFLWVFLWLTFTCTKRSNWNCCYCCCLCCCCCWVHVSWITPASPRGPVVLPATLHINACECLRPSMAALLPPCVHLHQILINMHCVLSFLSPPPAWPSLPSSLPPFLPSSPPPPPPPSPPFCMMYTLNPPSLFYHHHLLLLPLFLTYPLVSPPHRHWHGCMCCCMACGPPRCLVWHWPPPHNTSGPLGHSGRGGVQGLPDQPGLRYRQRFTGTYTWLHPPGERFNCCLFFSFCTFSPLFFLSSPSIKLLVDFPHLATSFFYGLLWCLCENLFHSTFTVFPTMVSSSLPGSPFLSLEPPFAPPSPLPSGFLCPWLTL